MNYLQLTDEQLLAKLATDDREAFRVIYNRYAKRIYTFARRKVASDIAEEIVQEIFVHLWQRRNTAIGNLSAYLFTAVRYGILNHFRDELIREKFILQNNRENTPTSEQYEHFLEEIQQSIEKALQNLPEKTQVVFRMSRFEGFSNKEIAEQLNFSEKAVEYHITQALKHLRQSLKPFLQILLLAVCL